MFRMRDERGPDPKVLCVPTADLRLAHLRDITDLEHFYRLEIQHFFHIYQDLEPGKSIDVERGVWAARAEAEAEIERSTERFRAVRRAGDGVKAAQCLRVGTGQAAQQQVGQPATAHVAGGQHLAV
jgi:inorganic pyrophosphatase